MRILFLFILLFSWVSTSLYADFEIGLEEKQDQNECLYKGQEVTIQDVLAAELHHLSNAVQKSVQNYSSRLVLSEADYEHLPEGSLLRIRLQNRNLFIQNIPVELNEDFAQNIESIYNYFDFQICLCDQCKAAIQRHPSLFKARSELYATLKKVVSDDHAPQSPFLIKELRDVLPEESLWRLKIDQVMQEEDQKKLLSEENIWQHAIDQAASLSNPRFHDPFSNDHK